MAIGVPASRSFRPSSASPSSCWCAWIWPTVFWAISIPKTAATSLIPSATSPRTPALSQRRRCAVCSRPWKPQATCIAGSSAYASMKRTSTACTWCAPACSSVLPSSSGPIWACATSMSECRTQPRSAAMCSCVRLASVAWLKSNVTP